MDHVAWIPTSPHTWEATLQNVGTEKQGKYLLPMDASLSRAGREEKSGKCVLFLLPNSSPDNRLHPPPRGRARDRVERGQERKCLPFTAKLEEWKEASLPNIRWLWRVAGDFQEDLLSLWLPQRSYVA